MDATGTPQFGGGGINVTTGAGCEAFMQMLSDGSGGAYVVWGNGGPNTSTFQSRDLFITRITSGGVVDPTWNTTGGGPFRPVQFPETTVTPSREYNGRIIDDGSGNIIARYESVDTSFYFAATKFSSTGAIAGAPWNTPLLVDIGANGNQGRHMVADGSGGVLFGYLAGPFGSPNAVEAQRVNAAGVLQWGAGVTVSTTNIDSYSGQPVIASDGTGGVFIGWHTAGGGSFDVFGHHVTSTGVLDVAGNWASAPIALSDTTDGNTDWFVTLDRNVAHPDGNNGAYFIYGSYEGGSWPTTKLQHLQSDGSVEFVGDGIPLAIGAGIIGVNSIMIPDGGTGVVTVFQNETPLFDMDLYMQHYDDLGGGTPPSGGGGGAGACAVVPSKLDLPQELEVSYQAGNPKVKLNWADVETTDRAASEKTQVLFDYLDQKPTPELNGTDTSLESLFAKEMYQQIYSSGDPALVDAFETELKMQTDQEGMAVTQILESTGINYKNDYFSEWWIYLFLDRLKDHAPASEAFMKAVSESLTEDPITYKQLIRNLLNHLSEIPRSPQELAAAQCITPLLGEFTLNDFVPGKGQNVYGAYDAELKNLLDQIRTEGSVVPVLDALKNDQTFLQNTHQSLKVGINALLFGWANNTSVQKLIDLYQKDSSIQDFRATLFKTNIVQGMEGCLKNAYKRDLSESVNQIRFNIIKKAIEKDGMCDTNVSKVVQKVMQELIQQSETKQKTEGMVLKFINEVLEVENHLKTSTSYMDSFSKYFDANYSPAVNGALDDQTLKIFRDGKLIHTAVNPTFTTYVDEAVPENVTTRVKSHKYYLLTETACDTKIGSEGTAYINPQLEPGTVIDVDADIKVKIKDSFNLLFMEKLETLVEAAKFNNQQILSADQSAQKTQAPSPLACQEATSRLSSADLNSDNLMNYLLSCHGGPLISPKIQAKRVQIVPPILIALKLNTLQSRNVVVDRYIEPVIEELMNEITRAERVFELVGPKLAGLDLSKGPSSFSQDEMELIICAGNPDCNQATKDKVTAYFEGASHATDLQVEVFDEADQKVHETEAKTNIFGEVKNLSLGEFLAGSEYSIKIRLQGQRFVLPKVTLVTLNSAEPQLGGGFKAHLDLTYARQFRYGNFDESNDVIDRNDILAWGKLISEQPELWDESNLDGLYGVDLMDVITFQKNWGEIKEAQLEEDQITLSKLAALFGLASSLNTQVQVPGWINFLNVSCEL
jgi:hypothetical protein